MTERAGKETAGRVPCLRFCPHALVVAGAFALLLAAPGRPAGVGDGEFGEPVPVPVVGYSGDAMEPFLSRDGRVLMFNSSNDPEEDTDLHWAERTDDGGFVYRGAIAGANSTALDGVPSMDARGRMFFVTTRSYEETLATIYQGEFVAGALRNVSIVEGVSRGVYGALNFDAEISADGETLYAVDGTFRGGVVPKAADIFIARRDGAGFVRDPASARIFAQINTAALEYAPATSANELTLYFTRLSGRMFWRKLEILEARRTTRGDAFGPPVPIAAISGIVEAPSLGPDGRTLYFHRKVGGVYGIYGVSR